MNAERLRKLVSIYVDKFDMLTGDDCDENMKWRAVHHFKNNFDLNAPDLYENFKYAMSESRIIINNGTVQPVNGILKLISYEQETVREMLARLFEDDGGDIDKRQGRIQEFVDKANELLDKYERGKWKYRQEFRSALAYLTFFRPEENYLYKASQCQPFFRYLEFGEELGSGQDFKLSRYYKMCDDVRTAFLEYDELISTHNERWQHVGDPKDNLHILTFDIIYCSIVYGFYDFENYSRSVKRNKASVEQEKIIEEIDEKNDELEKLEKELEIYRASYDNIPEVCLEGCEVKHRTYGVGKVVSQKGDVIEVKFSMRTSKFQAIGSIANGFLTPDDSALIERCRELESVIQTCKRLEKQISGKTMEISILSARLK